MRTGIISLCCDNKVERKQTENGYNYYQCTVCLEPCDTRLAVFYRPINPPKQKKLKVIHRNYIFDVSKKSKTVV